MARAQGPLPPAVAGGQAPLRHETSREEPKYTVMMESVTQKKKRLLAKTSFKIQPPKGYTFVSLSEPILTDKCKEMSRLAGVPIHIVSTSRGGQKSTQLSQQVGRIGHHFASDIVSKALAALGLLDLDGDGRLRKQYEKARKSFGNETARKDQKGTFIGEGITDKTKLNKEQTKLNAEAKAMLTTLFPGMPDKDVKAVIKHAFTIGKDRIGSSAEVSLDRRVHLAVLAHIRHGYTKYDKLLREVPYQTARSIVESDTLAKMIEWRGEDDKDHDGAVEEILREVIVIPDDDEDESPSPGADDDELVFSSEQVPADQIDDRPSTRMNGADYSEFLPYTYGRRTGQRPQLTEQERRERDQQFIRQRYSQAQQQAKVNPIRGGFPPPVDNGPTERRILIPTHDMDRRRHNPEPQRLIIQGPDGRDRELVPVRPSVTHRGNFQRSEYRFEHANAHAPQVGPRRPVDSPAYINGHTDAGHRAISPPRSRDIIHQSIESPTRPEIIDITSSPSNNNNDRMPNAQALANHRHSTSWGQVTGHHMGSVLGKRARDDNVFHQPASPVKAQRADGFSNAHSSAKPQMVTLSEAPHGSSDNYNRETVPIVSRPANPPFDGERRLAYPTRRPSDHAVSRKVVPDTAMHLESPLRPRSPNSQYIDNSHRSPPYAMPTHHNKPRIDRFERRDPQPEPRNVHYDRVGQINEMNSTAYQRNELQSHARPAPVAYHEPRDAQGPRTTMGLGPAHGAGHDAFPQSEPQSRVIYERVPISAPAARHVQSHGDLQGRAIEQSRFGIDDLRIHDRYQPSQPIFDDDGRQIVILEAPR